MHLRLVIFFGLSLWLGTLLFTNAHADAPIPWDVKTQGRYVTAVCRDLQGRIWVGTEDEQGVWSYDPDSKFWTQFPASPNLSGDIYALACDKAGRIWAGGTAGVSVYNGQQWKQYGPTDGPLGTRLFALAVSPKDGSVWGATEAGLFRYHNSRWTYFTRAEGLPSDQASSLAFAPDGTLYVGTQCNGIAIGSPANDYKTWRVVTGPRQMPSAATGSGLPSALINCLLVSAIGTVYAGTPLGLAASRDEGFTWHYRRGVDWKAKLAGLYHPLTPDSRPYTGDLLHDDYVTCLGEDGSGRLFIGHRQGGVEVFDPKMGKRVQSGANGGRLEDNIGALLVENKAVWVGTYGGGLLPPASPENSAAASTSVLSPTTLPIPAAPPTLAQLNSMLAQVKSLKGEMPLGGGAFLGEDWRTLGDWVGRYGRQYAVLCAIASPMDQIYTWDSNYEVQGQLGPHHTPDDALRHWLQPGMVNTPRLASLYSPVNGFRAQAEWDDHGETYPQTFEGPDVWVSVKVPEGTYRVSLYDTNKDGHDGDNSLRDYQVDLLPYRAKIDDALNLPPLAHTRIHNFWNGFYTSFLVRGPSQYWIHIAKNGSKNTVVAGVFIDKLSGPVTRFDHLPMAFMNAVHYMPPPIDSIFASKSLETQAAKALWAVSDKTSGKLGAINLSAEFRFLTLRTVVGNHEPDSLMNNWQWYLNIWTPIDRDWFNRNMELVQIMNKKYPSLILR